MNPDRTAFRKSCIATSRRLVERLSAFADEEPTVERVFSDEEPTVERKVGRDEVPA